MTMSVALPQHSNELANREASKVNTLQEQLTTIISATVTASSSSSSSTPKTRISQETNGNRNPDPSNGLIGPCVVSMLCECMLFHPVQH